MNRREAFWRFGIGFGVPLAAVAASIAAWVVASIADSVSFETYRWVVIGGLGFGLASIAGILTFAFGKDKASENKATSE